MSAALKHANCSVEQLGYINAHGTSTMADAIELSAIDKIAGCSISNINISSTKSSTGHLLGAAGAIEAIFCALALRDQIVPPTINLVNQDADSRFNLTPINACEKKLKYAMSNSFGFGGSNTSIVFSEV